MRYIAKERENSKNGIVTIIDSKPEHRWDSEVVTVFNLDLKKNKKIGYDFKCSKPERRAVKKTTTKKNQI